MPSVTIRNVPDEVHRAIRVRAAHNSRSIEAEMRDILETTVKPPGRARLGSLLSGIGRTLQLTEEEFAVFDNIRPRTQEHQARAADF